MDWYQGGQMNIQISSNSKVAGYYVAHKVTYWWVTDWIIDGAGGVKTWMMSDWADN